MSDSIEVDPRFCNAKAKGSGELCKLRAGWGTSHAGIGKCKFHGGASPLAVAKGTRLRTEAESAKALMKLGLPKDTDPQSELLRQVGISAARVDALHYQYEMAWEEWNRAPEEADEERSAKAQMAVAADTLMKLWNNERVRASKISKMAVDAGVAKRHVEIAERQGTTIFMVVQNVLGQLGMPPERQMQARQLLAGEFRRLADEEARD